MNMPDEDLKAEIERLRNENAALKKETSAGVRLKVTRKAGSRFTAWAAFP
jgi:hypothetical protein